MTATRVVGSLSHRQFARDVVLQRDACAAPSRGCTTGAPAAHVLQYDYSLECVAQRLSACLPPAHPLLVVRASVVAFPLALYSNFFPW
jgi:hypothetical protein